MEGQEIGLAHVVNEATELRRRTDATDVVIRWATEFGEVQLVVDRDGHQLFVNDEPVIGREH